MCLALLPVVLFTGGLARWSATRRDATMPALRRQLVTVVPFAWTLVAVVVGKDHSYVSDGIIGGVTFGGSTSGLTGLLYWALGILSAVAGGAVVAVAVAALARAVHGATWLDAFRRWLDRPERSLLLAFAVSSFGAACVSSYLQQSIFERYLFPCFAALLVLLCMTPAEPVAATPSGTSSRTARAAPSHRATVGALVLVFGLAVVAVLAPADGYALQAARWKGADIAVAEGIDVHTVDAGFEFIGSHYEGSARPASLDINTRYLDAFAGFRQCAVANPTTAVPAGSREIGQVVYRGGFGLVRRVLHVYATPC
jgi:hypothetical protein